MAGTAAIVGPRLGTNSMIAAKNATINFNLAMQEMTDATSEIIKQVRAKAASAGDALMPAFTHFRPAQPVLVAHFFLAHAAPLRRDFDRLALARAWSLRPDVWLLDEPTASLDPHAKREVEALATFYEFRELTPIGRRGDEEQVGNMPVGDELLGAGKAEAVPRTLGLHRDLAVMLGAFVDRECGDGLARSRQRRRTHAPYGREPADHAAPKP